MANREIEFAHHSGKHKPGDVVKVDEDEARQLVEGGVATYTQESKTAPSKA